MVQSKPKPDQTTNISTPYNVMRPIYDFKTKNKSFIEVHLQLKLLGVKNNAFHLLLLNPALQGVDPYDENLTPMQIMMIIVEHLTSKVQCGFVQKH